MSFTTFLVSYGGATLGSVIGIMGGVFGTWCSIRNTKTLAERTFMIRASIAIWLFVSAFLIGLFLIPAPYNLLLWIPYVIILVLGIQWMNRRHAQLRDLL